MGRTGKPYCGGCVSNFLWTNVNCVWVFMWLCAKQAYQATVDVCKVMAYIINLAWRSLWQ